MSQYRNALPQLSGGVFLTDGGIETTLIFHQGVALPCFAAFDLLSTTKGREQLLAYYRPYVELAIDAKRGLILESPTWRANTDWGKQLGYSKEALANYNRVAIEMMVEIRYDMEGYGLPVVISGCVGPRGDGYQATNMMDSETSRAYHAAQVNVFADTQADMATAVTMNYVEEAIGITWAAQDAEIPVVISFTVETDGRLPSGDKLKDAIEAVDKSTDKGPAYYMINCAHPDHFQPVLNENETWVQRIRGLRANASRCSHAELNEADTLDDGDPNEFGQLHAEIRARFPQINVLGGCCGTDIRHVRAASDYCQAQE